VVRDVNRHQAQANEVFRYTALSVLAHASGRADPADVGAWPLWRVLVDHTELAVDLTVPGGVEAVVIGTRPEAAEATMRECVELSITDVWMHRSFGVGSVFAAAEYTRNHRDRRRLPADVQPTADFGHKAMRFVLTPRRGAQADLRIRDPRGGALVGVRAAGGRRSPSAGSAGSCSPPRGSARRHPRARLPGPKRRTAPGPRTRRPTPRYQRRAHRPEA
jgi:hypothetical protein